MRHDEGVELIAHRAGNEPQSIGPALAVADAIELDLHQFRGRLEVRHAKALWPFAVFWEKWELVPGVVRPPLREILEATPADTHLWFDVKGFTQRVPRRLIRELGPRRPITVSCRSWWALRSVRRLADVRTFRSVGNRWQLWLVQRVRFADACDGIVMHERFASHEVLSGLRRLTPNIVVWAIDDVERALALRDLGVRGVIVDDLGVLAELRVRAGHDPRRAPAF